MTKRQIGIGIGAAVLGGAVALAIAFSGPADPIQTHSTARVPTVALTTSSTSRRPVLEIGVEHQYRAHLAQSVKLGDEAPFVISVDGTWAVAYAGKNEDGNELFRAQLRDAKPNVTRGGSDVSAALGASIGTAFYVTTSATGQVIAMSFPRTAADITRSALSTLATTFQVSPNDGESWEATETDTIGTYRAHYARASAGVRRERLTYDRVATGVAANVVTTGTDLVLRTEDNWLANLRGHEVTRFGSQHLAVVADATFSLEHTGTARVELGSRDDLVTVAVGANTAKRGPSEAEDLEMVDGASLADLIAGLATLTDDHAKGYQFLRIAALMRLAPENVRTAQKMILDGSPQSGLLIGALGEAGTPVAQKALGELLETPALHEEQRTQAAASMGLVQTPTPETVRALAAAAQGTGDVASTATLAQGNASLRMHDQDPAAAAAQVDALLARYRRAVDDQERALVLRALGNTGDPRILEVVVLGLASPTLDVQISATEALRLVPGAAADKLLLSRFTDPEALVRGAAVFATVERDLAPFTQALARAARQDPEIGVRRAIVDLAAARLADSPALRALVEQVAKTDADPEVREAARKILAG
jgi:HEAT repeat protein